MSDIVCSKVVKLNKPELKKLERLRKYVREGTTPRSYSWLDSCGQIVPLCYRVYDSVHLYIISILWNKPRKPVVVFDERIFTLSTKNLEKVKIPTLFELGDDLSQPFAGRKTVKMPQGTRDFWGNQPILYKTINFTILEHDEPSVWYDLEGNQLYVGDHIVFIGNDYNTDVNMLKKGIIESIKYDKLEVRTYDGHRVGVKRGVFKC